VTPAIPPPEAGLSPQHGNPQGRSLLAAVSRPFVTTGAVLEVSIAAFAGSRNEMSRHFTPVSNRRMGCADLPTAIMTVLAQPSVRRMSFRKHHARHHDVGAKARNGDHIVTWQRPQRCPQSAPDEFQAPDTACPRSSSVILIISAFVPKQIILVTNLLLNPKPPYP